MKKYIYNVVFLLLICLMITGCNGHTQSPRSGELSSSVMEKDESQSADIVNEDESVQIVRSMMSLDLTSMTVADFNETIQAMCVEADTNIFDVISDVYDHFAVYDDAGEFVGTVFIDRDLESFVETTLAYSAQEIFGEPVHLGSIPRITMPGMTAQELYQTKEQMPFDEWNSFFEGHISEINIYPVLSYSIDAIITNPDALLVSDRDDRINNVHAAIIAYIIGMDDETARAENALAVTEAELKEISREYSDTSISIKCRVQSLEQNMPEATDVEPSPDNATSESPDNTGLPGADQDIETARKDMESMLPILDSIVRTMGTGGDVEYVPDDPGFIWTVLYQIGNNRDAAHPFVEYDDDGSAIVQTRVLYDFACATSSIYIDVTLPAIPEDMRSRVKYDEENDEYIFSPSDMGGTMTKLDDITVAQDGSVTAIVGLYDGAGDPEDYLGSVSFTLVRQAGTGRPRTSNYLYNVTGATK